MCEHQLWGREQGEEAMGSQESRAETGEPESCLCGTYWTQIALQLWLCPSPGAFTFTELYTRVPRNPPPHMPVSQGQNQVALQQKPFYVWTEPLMSKHPWDVNTGPATPT